MTISNTLGHNTEITIRIVHEFAEGQYILECTKIDSDTWLLTTYEPRGDEKINKNAMIIYGDQLRALVEHKYMFGK